MYEATLYAEMHHPLSETLYLIVRYWNNNLWHRTFKVLRENQLCLICCTRNRLERICLRSRSEDIGSDRENQILHKLANSFHLSEDQQYGMIRLLTKICLILRNKHVTLSQTLKPWSTLLMNTPWNKIVLKRHLRKYPILLEGIQLVYLSYKSSTTP